MVRVKISTSEAIFDHDQPTSRGERVGAKLNSKRYQ